MNRNLLGLLRRLSGGTAPGDLVETDRPGSRLRVSPSADPTMSELISMLLEAPSDQTVLRRTDLSGRTLWSSHGGLCQPYRPALGTRSATTRSWPPPLPMRTVGR